MDKEISFVRLAGLATFLEQQSNLDESLGELPAMASLLSQKVRKHNRRIQNM